VAVAQLTNDQAALAGAAAGNPGAERDVANILNVIKGTSVPPNIPVLSGITLYGLNEKFGSICARWGMALTCSPKPDPCVMRVQEPLGGARRTFDVTTKETTQPGAGRAIAAGR